MVNMTKREPTLELTSLMENVWGLLDEVVVSQNSSRIEQIFNELPGFVFTDEPWPFNVDGRPQFLGNPYTPQTVREIIENMY